jgi:hypothetical protein
MGMRSDDYGSRKESKEHHLNAYEQAKVCWDTNHERL